MKNFRFSCRALVVGLGVALLAGCAGSQPPIGAPHAMPQSVVNARHAYRETWMLPEARGRNLLYVSEHYQPITYVFQYPGGQLVGGLAYGGGGSGGLCSNKAGDVFVTTDYGVYEYPHGRATPVAELGDPFGTPNGCSVDPVNGNLAVLAEGGVAIYHPQVHHPHRWHLPRLYSVNPDVYFLGFDGSGDLFVDGKLSSAQPFMLELPKGESTFETVTLNVKLSNPGNIEWDGKYLAVGDENNVLIHRFSISGSQGTQVGSARFKGPTDIWQFWIQGGTLIGPAFRNGYYIGYWKYPRGGSQRKTLQEDEAYGATVSLSHLHP